MYLNPIQLVLFDFQHKLFSRKSIFGLIKFLMYLKYNLEMKHCKSAIKNTLFDVQNK